MFLEGAEWAGRARSGQGCVFVPRAMGSVHRLSQGVMGAGSMLRKVPSGCCVERRLEGTGETSTVVILEGEEGGPVIVETAELERASRKLAAPWGG